jgi:hypothetical protein
MPGDGQLVARTVAELRAMPEAADLLGRLGRLVDRPGAPSSAATIRHAATSLQAPPVAVLLTLIRACDQATVMEADLGPTPPTSTPPSDTGGSFRTLAQVGFLGMRARPAGPTQSSVLLFLPGVGRRKRPIDGAMNRSGGLL